MIASDDATEQDGPAADAAPRRARVAVLGEFSAGKSTFINLVTGGRTLRTQVTATQMPAVWMSHGTGTPLRVDLDGNETPVDLRRPGAVSVEDTAYIRAFSRTPVLEICDLIDTPGNSDPNIAPIAWERIAELADVAVWCSPATQAWRQSEAAAWAEMPDRLRENSVLLLTRADKLLTATDREKVLRRVKAEAGPLFGAIHMVSLLDLASVQPAFRDIVGLCRAVNAEATPGPVDTAHVLRAMAAAPVERAEAGDDLAGAFETPRAAEAPAPETTAPEAAADESEARDDADFAFAEREARAQPAPAPATPGFATALWTRMTEGLPDDPDAVDQAFERFLARLDREIADLCDEIRPIGKAG